MDDNAVIDFVCGETSLEASASVVSGTSDLSETLSSASTLEATPEPTTSSGSSLSASSSDLFTPISATSNGRLVPSPPLYLGQNINPLNRSFYV